MPKCPKCGSDASYRYGQISTGKKRFLCLACNRQFVEGSAMNYNNRPVCPCCGAKMHVYKYDKETVRFRCSNYPNCRKYVKISQEKLTQ